MIGKRITKRDGTQKIVIGYDITVWVDEPYELAEQIFDAIEEMISEKFDIHGPDDACVIGWGMGMGPSEFDLDLFSEEELLEIDGGCPECGGMHPLDMECY